jgi:plastocyanin
MKKMHNIVLASALLSTALLFGVVFSLYGYHGQMAVAAPKGKSTTATATTSSTATNGMIKLSAKEVKSGVYAWIDNSTGKTNPTLKVFANANNTISIQNPTDTKHELIIDTGSDVLPSSDDIAAHGVGQLAFSPNMTGTFTYHCAYHPFTMKGTIQIVPAIPTVLR